MYKISLFIFRRDLRVDDNTGLIEALKESECVIPLFICTPTQLSEKNKYKSSNAIQFMIESLYNLDQQIKDLNPKCNLWITYDDEIDVLKKIKKDFNIGAIYVNEDYSPYSIKRDKSIDKFCKEHDIVFKQYTDILLLDTNDIKTTTGNYYRIFTQFYKRCKSNKIRKPNYEIESNFMKKPKKYSDWNVKNIDQYLLKKKFYQKNDNILIHGGRTNALEIFNGLKHFKDYKTIRDQLWKDTTHLSAHNKFGTVSIREVYYAFKNKAKSEELCQQLYWRDFYYYVGIHFDELYKYDHIYKEKDENTKEEWDNDKKLLRLWKEAKTGFPIVDAAMMEINTTGFMHNRARMIVASFLTKDLLVDWKYGEQYFSQTLIDIDRAQNTGNWNWSASYGLDATTFLRIFNPWSQSEKYDPQCKYIKKWLPQLREIKPEHLHHWNEHYQEYPDIDYPSPIVDHAIQRKLFKKFYDGYFK